MTDNPNETPEPLEVPLQDPPAEQAPAPAAKTGHTRTILEVVGGVAAVVLIGLGTIFGFVVGRVSADDHMRDQARVAFEQRRGGDQGMQQGPGGMMGGQDGMRGHHGPKGMMDDHQGPGGMMDQRGIDPDGDNWTGQNQQGTPAPAPSQPAPAPGQPSQAG